MALPCRAASLSLPPPPSSPSEVAFSLETLGPLQICSQSAEGNRTPRSHTRAVHRFPQGQPPGVPAPEMPLGIKPCRGLGGGEPPISAPRLQLLEFGLRLPHLRDHNVSHSLPCSLELTPQQSHLLPQNVLGTCNSQWSQRPPLHPFTQDSPYSDRF